MGKDDIYRHKKTGNLYMVITEAIHCTNGQYDNEIDIIYAPVDETQYAKMVKEKGTAICTRVKHEFFNKFEKVGE